MPPPLFSASTADLEAEARRIAGWIASAARRAKTDPAYAAKSGIAPVQAMTLFSSSAEAIPTEADWVRGAVTALLPSGWLFELDELIDGRAFLTIRSDATAPPRPGR